MTNYDFAHLSSYEFELLVRDLVQQELSIQLESFKSGRDGGVDLRHCSVKDGTTIVQCKRYVESDFDDLYKEMRKECLKVEVLKPTRYILATSLGLLPQQKDKLKTLLSPFCQITGDIYGKDDLNNLLGQYPDIERKHHKLWLHSFEILRTVYSSSILNFTQAELERIGRKRQYYVPTESFNEALQIMKEQHYCVITGIPGIGKTTLAEMLILAHARHSFEIIKVSEDIDEAFTLYKKEKQQLFYYDDFLGQTGLQSKLGKNEDDRLIAFITLVRNCKTTRFILTTREYILKQAQADYERLSHFDFEKCVLEPPKYSEYQRARILYNHVFFSVFSTDHKRAILKNRNYLKIVNHRGFNPRLISLMTESRTTSRIPADQYFQRFTAHLDNPEDIWSHAFEHQISQSAKNLLLIMVTLPNRVLLEDVRAAFNEFHYARVSRYSLPATPHDFRISLSELEDTFLRIEKTHAGDDIVIQFHNPSVRDFMENFLAGSSTDTKDIVEFAQFFDQLEFVCSPSSKEQVRQIIRRHALTFAALPDRLVQCFETAGTYLHHGKHPGVDVWTEMREPWSLESRLWLLVKLANILSCATLNEFITRKLHQVHANVAERDVNKEELVELLEALDSEEFALLASESRSAFLEESQEFLCEDLTEFQEFKLVADSIRKTSAWKSGYVSDFRKKFEEFFDSEYEDLPADSEFEDKIETARDVAEALGLALHRKIDELENLREEYLREESSSSSSSPSWTRVVDPQTRINAEIDAMFAGLE